MRISQYFLGTLKNDSCGGDNINHQLMLRAGLIRKVASGLYAWLPTGVRVLRKVENIIREEMNKIGAIEINLPMVQPAKLWKKSGRWTQYGPELLRFKNRVSQEFILSPTHEELVAEVINKEIVSYKQLPLIFYQIQNKFRDEMRPRCGMFRLREFIMKDGYSFHINNKSLQSTYEEVYKTYNIIFNRFKLNFCSIQADSGNIGGGISHEFRALINNCENSTVYSARSNYLYKVNLSEFTHPLYNLLYNEKLSENIKEKIKLSNVVNLKKITNIFEQYQIPQKKFVQNFIVHASKKDGCSFLALLVCFDHDIDYTKVEKLSQVILPLSCAIEDEIYSLIGISSSVLGSINLRIPLIIDRSVGGMKGFIFRNNNHHDYCSCINGRYNFNLSKIADLKKIASNNYNINKKGILNVKNSIEIGHIFQLGNKYLSALSSKVQGKNKKIVDLTMGCYGIGISRIIAVIVDQNHDENGIIWPEVLAPFFLAIIPIDMYRSCYVSEVANKLYNQFSKLNVDVVLDDRDVSSGIKFSDMELIGVPHSIVVSDKSLNTEEVEYKCRGNHFRKKIKINAILDFFLMYCKSNGK